MYDFETYEEEETFRKSEGVFWDSKPPQLALNGFRAGWLASRDYWRAVAEREIATATERLAARREG